MALADIDTIVIAMLENRSFDHMLGYLSLNETPARMPVDGLRSDQAWRDSYRNEHDGTLYGLKHLPLGQVIDDPAHSEAPIAIQVGKPPAGPGATLMGGFVESYATFWDPGKKKKKPAPDDLGAVMGYYNGGDVPSLDFLARNYCVCDRWFAPLPLGTQANRLMAMAGESKVADNKPFPMQKHALVYEWLSKHKIDWCVYQWGGYFPFFTLMPKWIPEIVPSLTASGIGVGGGKFRRYKRFAKDWASATHGMPKVIFVEPEYGDGPHSKPNDDHPPLGVTPGQDLLKDLYKVLTGNPARWAKTLLIVTYDEHGGFFDHVPPLPIPAAAGGRPFATTGLRVPALLVSPHVGAGAVFSGPLDHTSILQLLDEKFAGGKGYSKAVAGRSPPLRRISEALLATPRSGPAPAFPVSVAGTLAAVARAVVAPVAALFARAGAPGATEAPDTPNALAMDMAARKMEQDHPALIDQPGWEELRAYLRTNDPPEPGPKSE